MAQINLRVNDAVKAKAESACSAMGLTMSSAINIFLTKVGNERRIPFEVSADPLPILMQARGQCMRWIVNKIWQADLIIVLYILYNKSKRLPLKLCYNLRDKLIFKGKYDEKF